MANKKPIRMRLDSAMVRRSIADSLEIAGALVLAGRVKVDGRSVTKAGQQVNTESVIKLSPGQKYVSRGGIKLAQSLIDFGLDVSNNVVLDIGSSTGGFTDCLLRNGASRVYAVDTGYGQLDYSLRQDPRVSSMERTNARYPLNLAEKVDLITIDVSFISLKTILPAVLNNLQEGGHIVALVKPQFEANRGEVGKGGVIRDPSLHAKILARMIVWMVNNKYRIMNLVASTLTGDKGNREFFVLIRHDSQIKKVS